MNCTVMFGRARDAGARRFSSRGYAYVERNGVNVSCISPYPAIGSDRVNGITKRYSVSFNCAASNVWNVKSNAYSEWRPSGCAFFPSASREEERS